MTFAPLLSDIATFLQQFAGEPSTANPSAYDSILAIVLHLLIFLANLAGGIVVGVATIRGIITYAHALLSDWRGPVPKEEIRLTLGRSLSLALEFQLAADILGTALNPTLRDIATLAAIAALRTALNYFLGQELREAQRRDEHAAAMQRNVHNPERVAADD